MMLGPGDRPVVVRFYGGPNHGKAQRFPRFTPEVRLFLARLGSGLWHEGEDQTVTMPVEIHVYRCDPVSPTLLRDQLVEPHIPFFYFGLGTPQAGDPGFAAKEEQSHEK